MQHLVCPGARSIAHQHLADGFSCVLVPGHSTQKGLHCSFPRAPWVTWLFSGRCLATEEGCQLRKFPMSICCDHTAVCAIACSLRIFFSVCEGKKCFCQEGMTRTEWLRDCLWPMGCWHLAGNCLQPSSQALYSPRVPSPRISSDVLQGLVRACLLWTFGKAGSTGRQVFSY